MKKGFGSSVMNLFTASKPQRDSVKAALDDVSVLKKVSSNVRSKLLDSLPIEVGYLIFIAQYPD